MSAKNQENETNAVSCTNSGSCVTSVKYSFTNVKKKRKCDTCSS